MAAPSPISTINHRALANIQIELTQNGMAAFETFFPAALGPLLSLTLKSAITSGKLHPTDTKTVALFALIYDQLILLLTQHPDIAVQIARDCNGNGPLAYLWLTNRYNPKSSVTGVKKLIGILDADVNGSSDVRALISDNNGLSYDPDLKLSDTLLVVLIMMKLKAPCFQPLRDHFVLTDTVPPLAVIQEKILAIEHFSGEPSPHAAFATFGKFVGPVDAKTYCHNCGALGKHHTRACPAPKATCDICGTGAGHLPTSCWIKNNKQLPQEMSPAHKAEIEAKQEQYRLTNGNAANLCAGDDEMDTEEFWRRIGAV